MEDFVLLLFLASVAAVYLLAALAVARIILRRFGRLAAPSGHQLWIQRIALGLAAAGVACMAYGYFIEPYCVPPAQLFFTNRRARVAGCA